ncbi:MAG TPA: nuclear transport factor 2 family protein [Solirubrobacteraceae bacterium]|nr:nuclear transport factor 2 family protein [Solirubrobacteraceae bacterium]
MSASQEPTAVAVARAHVDAWGVHDYDAARGSLAPDVHVVVTSVDPQTPFVDTTGADAYMEGLIEFGHAVLADTTHVTAAEGDDARAMLRVSSRVKFGPDAPEMTLDASRLYRLDETGKIAEERVIFYVSAE